MFPLPLWQLAVGVVVFFGAVIWFGLGYGARMRRRAIAETPDDERARFTTGGAASAGARRLFRMVHLEALTDLRFEIQDEARAVLATLVTGPLAHFSSTLNLAGTSYEVLVQARRSHFFGKGGGAAQDSVVIRDERGCVFEAIPWATPEGERGSTARVADGQLELVWSGFSRRLVRERAQVLLNGQLVGEVVLLTDGSFKRLVALDSAVAAALVPFLFVAVHAGVYDLKTKRSRSEAASLAGLSAQQSAGIAARPVQQR